MTAETGRQKPLFPLYIIDSRDMSEGFNSCWFYFNLQVKLSRNMTLNILTDEGSHIVTLCDLPGASLQTACLTVAWGRVEIRISAKFCFNGESKQSGATGRSVQHQGSDCTLEVAHFEWLTCEMNCPEWEVSMWLPMSAVDVSRLKNTSVICACVSVCLSVWENIFPSATIDGNFLESPHGWETHIFCIPSAVLVATELSCSFSFQCRMFAVLDSAFHLIFASIINTRFSKQCDTTRVIVLKHWVEKWIDLNYFRMESAHWTAI